MVAALLLPAPALVAQTRAQIFGRVTTRTAEGEPLALPGAVLVLVDKSDPGSRFTTESDEIGNYSLLDVPGGIYTLTATLNGYEDHSQDVAVEPGTVLEIKVELAVGTMREQITVTAGANSAEIQTDQSAHVEQLSGALFDSAALASERFLDALPLLPGVMRGPDGLMKIKGAASTQSGWLVNSANVTDPATGEQAINLPVDVIQEIEVLPNPYSAEYGKFAGAVTSIETRTPSGGWKFKLNNFLPRPRRRNGHIRGIESATPRLTLGGPLYKNKLFLLQSFEYRLLRSPVTSLPQLERDSDIESFDSFTQFDLNFSTLHKAALVFSVYPQKNRFATLNTFNPQPSTANRKQRGWMGGLRDRFIFATGAMLETTLSIKDFDVDVFQASPGAVYLLQPDFNGGSYFNRQNRVSRRYEWVETYSLAPRRAAGQHWLKIGANVAQEKFRGLYASKPTEVRRADGTLAERIDFTGGGLVARNKTETTLFLQDKWNVNRRLTLDLGARYDFDTIADDHNFAPRLGFALVLTDDSKTVLRGGAGLYYDKIPLNVAVFEQFQQRIVTRFDIDGLTPLAGPFTFENRLTETQNPRSLAFSLELDRELQPGLLLRVGYSQRETRHDYIVEAFENGGLAPVLEAASRGRSRYREFQITGNYNFRSGSFLNVSYVRSRSEGDLNDFQQFYGTFQNPVLRPNEISRLAPDAPNRVLGWGDIEIFWGIHWAPTVEVRDGFPLSLVDEERNFVGRRNRGGRFPLNITVDSQVYKRFKVEAFGKERTVMVGGKIFNILNHFNPRDAQQNIDATNALGFFNSRGRLLRGKFTVEF